jgi:GntR family transcriptional regulator
VIAYVRVKRVTHQLSSALSCWALRLSQIRARILAGDLPADSELPSIRSLARKVQVSVITVQRAYETLERAGLIRAQRSRGFYVVRLDDAAKQALALAQLETRLTPLLEQALAEGLSAASITRLIQPICEGVATP